MADEKDAPKDDPSAVEDAAAAHQVAEHEVAIARLKLERATVERDLARLAQPWWRSWNVTAIGAFLAAVAPATAGVAGYFEKQKQLALQEQKQRHEIAMAQQKQDEDIRAHYLDRVLDPKQARRTMRLLAATSSDDKVRQWAKQELPLLDQDAQRFDEEQARLDRRADGDEELLRRLLETKSSDELIKRVADIVGMSRLEATKHKAVTMAKGGKEPKEPQGGTTTKPQPTHRPREPLMDID